MVHRKLSSRLEPPHNHALRDKRGRTAADRAGGD
jgi:hypothetical protein